MTRNRELEPEIPSKAPKFLLADDPARLPNNNSRGSRQVTLLSANAARHDAVEPVEARGVNAT
jgi:hypothetical protein